MLKQLQNNWKLNYTYGFQFQNINLYFKQFLERLMHASKIPHHQRWIFPTAAMALVTGELVGYLPV